MCGVTALLDSIAAGDADVVKGVLVADPDLASVRDVSGVSPLLHCLYRGRRDLADLVLDARPELDLFDAAALDDVAAVATLLAEQVGVDGRAADGYTALHLAAFFDAPHVAALLLRAGADPAAVAVGPSAVQPLHSAVAGHATAVACALLATGVDPDPRQQGGFTPLMAAAQHGDALLVDLLLAVGADPHRATDDGRTVVDLAVAGGHHDLADRLRRA